MERQQPITHLNLLVEDYKDELGNEDYMPSPKPKASTGATISHAIHKAVDTIRSAFSRGDRRVYSH